MTDPSATLSWALFEPADAGFETTVERSVALDESHGVACMLDWFHEAIHTGDGGDNIAISRTVTMLLEGLDNALCEA